MKFAAVLALSCTLLSQTRVEAAAPVLQEAPALGVPFEAEGLTGTFVLLDIEKNHFQTWNVARARTRFIPASTFKIANSLIGLESGAVASVDEVLPYGGKPQMMKEWEQDLPLREAMKLSSVPVYQELARRIGAERMASGVKSLGYGNAATGEVIDRFWLDGPLEISAVEQVAFLARLLKDKLPLKPGTMKIVREIIPVETEGGAVIHYKTGWCTAKEPQIGWIVGWVESGGTNAPFALNIDMKDLKDAPKRMLVLKACVKIAGKLGGAQ